MKKRLSFLSIVIAFTASAFLILPIQRVSAQLALGGTLTQQDYRWYVNLNSETETDPWPPGGTDLAEDTPITTSDSPPADGDILRLRMNIAVTNSPLVSGSLFKLQYAQTSTCSSGGATWVDVGGIGGSGDWIGYDNASPADGATLSSALLSSSNVVESYSEQSPAATPNGVLAGQNGEWDFVLKNNGALSGAHYCFRLVYSYGLTLSAYNDYPQLDTSRLVAKSQNWRWYGDEDHETPTDSLAAENVKPIGLRSLDPVKLRVTAKNTTGISADNQIYGLQYSTDTNFGDAAFVVMPLVYCQTTSTWCLADGVDGIYDPLTALLLTDSDTLGIHQEALTQGFQQGGGSIFTHGAYQAAEMEYTLKAVDVVPGTEYFFRLFDFNADAPVEVASGHTPPSIVTRNPTLAFEYDAVDAGASVDSYTTNVTSTTSGVDFGTVIPGQDYIAAHELHVTEDGLGYQISIYSTGPLQNAYGQTIDDFESTNALPAPWSFTPTATTTGAFGYHTTDNLLSNGSTRFASDDTWAGFSTTPGEIVYTDGTAVDDVHDILYRLNIGSTQAPLGYETDIFYVVTGIF